MNTTISVYLWGAILQLIPRSAYSRIIVKSVIAKLCTEHLLGICGWVFLTSSNDNFSQTIDQEQIILSPIQLNY
jgi:hypothetical protein